MNLISRLLKSLFPPPDPHSTQDGYVCLRCGRAMRQAATEVHDLVCPDWTNGLPGTGRDSRP